MKILPVNSSNIVALAFSSNGYEGFEQGNLYVQFKAGKTEDFGPWYVYEGIEAQEVTYLVFSPSVGSYLNSYIKPNYPATRLSDEEVRAMEFHV